MIQAKAVDEPVSNAVHLCIDMQNIFARGNIWETPWMERVLPVIADIAARFAKRTVFTRFITPENASDRPGQWQTYYRRWQAATRFDAGKSCGAEANMAKLLASEAAWEAAEMAMTTYLCARAHGKAFTAIPVFPMRAFHHGAILYNTNSGVASPKDLEGKRVGVFRPQRLLQPVSNGGQAIAQQALG